MSKYYKFNLNSYVLVHLDANGIEILKKHYNTEDPNTWRSNDEPTMFRFQMWQFMDIFGGKSKASYAPYSTEVLIDKINLETKLDKILGK